MKAGRSQVQHNCEISDMNVFLYRNPYGLMDGNFIHEYESCANAHHDVCYCMF